MDSKRLAITKAFFNKITRSRPKERRKVLKEATNEELKGLCEVCINVVRGNVQLSKKRFACFKRHKNLLHKLSSKRVSLRTKRKAINQQGGFLGTLAAFGAPLLTQLAIKGVGKLVKHYKRKQRQRRKRRQK